jgi:hypothetical protein
MTPAELAAAKALYESASPEPWTADLDQFSEEDGVVACVSNAATDLLFTGGPGIRTVSPERFEHIEDGAPWTAEDEATRNAAWASARESQDLKDAAFIAASRTLVPALIAEVERLRDRLLFILRACEDPDQPGDARADAIGDVARKVLCL